MRLKKQIEYILIQFLAVFSSSLAKLFTFRKLLNLTFSNLQAKKGEVELLLLPYLLDKDALFIDIGANKGLYTFYAEKTIPQSKIIAFEPVPKMASVLRKLFPKVTVVEKALSDQDGNAILNIPVHVEKYLVDTRSTLEKDSHELSGAFEKVPVEITTLDNYLENRKSEKTSLIKADVEGHEIKLIAGAKNTLLNKRPYLIIEIDLASHSNDLNKPFACIDQLNYTLYYFDLDSLSLKLAYDPSTKRALPLETTHIIHNYVCFPNEKVDTAKQINSSIKQSNR